MDEQTGTGADQPMGHDVPIATTEEVWASQQPTKSSPSDDNMKDAVEVKQEEDETTMPFAHLAIVPTTKPKEKIYFFKRMTGTCPRFDALVEVGQGELRPDSEDYNIENGMWEITDDLYVLRQTGPSFKVLQTVGKAVYTADMSSSKAKHIWGLKTCALLGSRDSAGELHVLKLCISGDTFKLLSPSDSSAVLHHPKWTRRVKVIARILGLKMGSPYDSHGRKASAEDVGDWAAGHTEKRLSAFAVYAMLRLHGCPLKKMSTEVLRGLKAVLDDKGLAPHFEIHLTRAPCGIPYKPGKCVPFVQRLGHLTGISFTIHYWEDNVILDGSVPPRTKKKTTRLRGDSSDSSDDPDGDDHPSDSEEEELQQHLAEKYPDDWGLIVRDGFDEARRQDRQQAQANTDTNDSDESRRSSPSPQQMISPDALLNFRDRIRREFTKRTRVVEVPKPYPPTPVDEDEFAQVNESINNATTSDFFEDATPTRPEADDLERRRIRASKARAKARAEERKKKKRAAGTARESAAATSAGTDDSAGAQGASVFADRLGALSRGSRLIG